MPPERDAFRGLLLLLFFFRVVRFTVRRWGGFLAGFGVGLTWTNWMGFPLARMRSSTSSSGRDAKNLFKLLEPKLRTSKSG